MRYKLNFKNFFKKTLRQRYIQKLLSFILSSYIKLVYFTSKVDVVNKKLLDEYLKIHNNGIFLVWHNRIIFGPIFKMKCLKRNNNILALVSKHGDGLIIANILKRFKISVIEGSSRNNRKQNDKGITIGSMKKIYSSLKNNFLVVTPDGPRGPNQKVNGKILNIAQATKTPVICFSGSSSKNIRFTKSWDNFFLPLPFSKIKLVVDKKIFLLNNDLNEEGLHQKIKEIEEGLNNSQTKSEAKL